MSQQRVGMQFGDWFRAAGKRSLVVFGDSITVGVGATVPRRGWAGLVAAELAIKELRNAGISGSTLQSSPMADGLPRPGNGFTRYRAALIEARADAIVILYGYNDARYTAAPDAFNVEAFSRQYHEMVAALLGAGYVPGDICIGSPPFIPTMGLNHGSPGFTGQSRAGFEEYVHAVEALAHEFRCFYAPVYERMATHRDGTLASPDITHPNDLGHEVIARSVLEATVGVSPD